MMDPLFPEHPAFDKSLGDWKPSLGSFSALELSDHAALPAVSMATTPELERALMRLATVPALSTSRDQNYVEGLVRSVGHDLPVTVSEASSSANLSPVSLISDSGDQTNRLLPAAFTFEDVPSPPTLPDSPHSTSSLSPPTTGTATSSSRGGLHRDSVTAALAGAPLASLDPKTQDELKKQRKKERNRIAAMKCRRRKLEREMELEGKVKALKQQNTDLMGEVIRLRSQVISLKQTVINHIGGGCSLLVGPGQA